MLQLWKVRAQDGDGKELYGEDYADIWAINRLHFKAASPFECDHVSVFFLVFSIVIVCSYALRYSLFHNCGVFPWREFCRS